LESRTLSASEGLIQQRKSDGCVANNGKAIAIIFSGIANNPDRLLVYLDTSPENFKPETKL
jgi:hypothetical protein